MTTKILPIGVNLLSFEITLLRKYFLFRAIYLPSANYFYKILDAKKRWKIAATFFDIFFISVDVQNA